MTDGPPSSLFPPFTPKYRRRLIKRARRGLVHALSPAEAAFARREESAVEHDAAQGQWRRERHLRQKAIINRLNAVWIMDQMDIGGLARADYATLHQAVDIDEGGTYSSEIGSTLHHRIVAHLHRLLTGLPDPVEAEDAARDQARQQELQHALDLTRAGYRALSAEHPEQARAVLLRSKRYSERAIAAELGTNQMQARLILAWGHAYITGYVAARIALAQQGA